MPQTLRRGKDEIVTVVLRFIHPSDLIRENFLNSFRSDRLDGCKVLQQEDKMRIRKKQRSVGMTHESFLGEELYVLEKYARLTLRAQNIRF